MGRALAIAAIALVAALGVVAAPALSTKPYRPEPVDFSIAAGGVLGEPGPADGVVSEPVEAPKRFNLVGLTWSGGAPAAEAAGHADEPALAMRTRTDDGEWSRWAPVTAHAEDGPDPGSGEAHADGMSNPVWAGEADWVQYRSSDRLADVRLHFVNTDGTATVADSVRTAVRDIANTAVTATAGLLSAELADAQDPQPEMVPRASWAGDDCPPRTGAVYGEVRAAYVHHTVNINDYSRAEAPQVVLGICRYHRNTNGWNDVGYNFLVDRFGTLYEGRAGGVGAAVVGAQAEGFNSYSTGIANIGTFSDVPQSREALEAMARLIRWKLPLHGYPTNGTAVMQSAGGGTNRYSAGTTARVPRVLGHRDTNATECPGTALYSQLEELRSMVAGVAPTGVGTSIAAELDAPRSAIDYGDDATVSGTLSTRDGAPVAGQPVTVQARVDGAWRTSSTPVTAADGTFAATVEPRVTRQLRVRFAGAGDLRSSVTPTLTLAVRPVVGLRLLRAQPSRGGERAAAPRGRAAVVTGDRVVLRGRVRPRVGRVLQVLRIQRSQRVARFRLAGTKTLRVGARGHFRASFVPAERGIYRVYVVARATATRARGSSDKIDVAVNRSASRSQRERAQPQRGGARAR
ncbi:MAG TPA: N-acetylmuramoyl-L-alanine amidase [Thermoleophilaceae bacterium]|nr:N-acetylmuramoyl-L-alanine amidase [Thermoleophilaceae bacterium]